MFIIIENIFAHGYYARIRAGCCYNAQRDLLARTKLLVCEYGQARDSEMKDTDERTHKCGAMP